MHVEIIINESALKHGISKEDIRSTFTTFLLDAEVGEGEDEYEKYLVIGFDTKGNLIELMYNLIDETNINVFHAMKCRKEYLKLLER